MSLLSLFHFVGELGIVINNYPINWNMVKHYDLNQAEYFPLIMF